ncbi:unnamed protein product [Rotaria sp. Silwood1]|nr:unnamed protein product [Rotaria sp. Silwood1]
MNDLIKINDLDKDELYNEYCEIKFLYDNLIKTGVKLSDQIKLYISSKKDYLPTSTINDNPHNFRMDIELVDAELKIRMNSDYPCAYVHKYLLSQPDLLKKIRTDEKYEQKKRRGIE